MVKPITSRNLQANAILERVHQTIGNIPYSFKVQSLVLDDPWDGILASTMFSLRTAVQTTTQYTPVRLIFGCNSIINQCHNIDWEIIMKQKQDLINKGSKCKDHNGIKHTYKKETRSYFKTHERQNSIKTPT